MLTLNLKYYCALSTEKLARNGNYFGGDTKALITKLSKQPAPRQWHDCC